MVFLAALQLLWRRVAGLLFLGFSCVVCACGAGGARLLVCCARLWGSCWWRLGRCVLCARGGVCAMCWWWVWVPVPASLGLFWRLRVGAGLCAAAPFLPRLWGPGVVPRHPLSVPSPLFLFAASLGVLFPWCLARAYPDCGGCAVGPGGGWGL